MNSSAQNNTESQIHKVKGNIKKAVGLAIDDPNLKAEGEDEILDGKVQKKVSQIQRVFEK